MAKVIDGITYDEDDYPITPMGVRTGPRRTPKDTPQAASVAPPASGGSGGGGGSSSMMGGASGMTLDMGNSIYNVGSPSYANPMLGKRSPALEGLTLALQKPRNY